MGARWGFAWPRGISHHFAVLREAGLVLTRTEGTRCLNTVREQELEKRFPGLLDLLVSEGRPKPVKGRKLAKEA